MTTSSSRAMKMAHMLQGMFPEFQWSNLLRKAWFFVRMRRMMHHGVVTFSFRKRDGSLREAKGTLHTLLIPADDMPHGIVTPARPELARFTYYDLERKEWRSFRIAEFLEFKAFYRLEKM